MRPPDSPAARRAMGHGAARRPQYFTAIVKMAAHARPHAPAQRLLTMPRPRWRRGCARRADSRRLSTQRSSHCIASLAAPYSRRSAGRQGSGRRRKKSNSTPVRRPRLTSHHLLFPAGRSHILVHLHLQSFPLCTSTQGPLAVGLFQRAFLFRRIRARRLNTRSLPSTPT